jgi:hypothetical protein
MALNYLEVAPFPEVFGSSGRSSGVMASAAAMDSDSSVTTVKSVQNHFFSEMCN